MSERRKRGASNRLVGRARAGSVTADVGMQRLPRALFSALMAVLLAFSLVPMTQAGASEQGDAVYAPGTYNVSARMHIPAGQEGVDSDIALTEDPAANNAALTIGSDGTASLTVPLSGSDAALEGLGSSSSASVVSSEQGDAGLGSVTLRLADYGGYYLFSQSTVRVGAETDPVAADVVLDVDFSGVAVADAGEEGAEPAPTADEEAAGSSSENGESGSDAASESNSTSNDEQAADGSVGENAEALAALMAVPAPSSRIAVGEKTLEPGTYTITANLSMPGETNPILPGMTPYFTNPNNPFGIGDGESAIPTDPVYLNATVVVAEDGTKTFTIPVKNPVFTIKDMSSSDGAEVVSLTKDNSGEDMQGNKYERVTEAVIKVTGWETSIRFDMAEQFVTMFQMTMNNPIDLTIDYTTAYRIDPDAQTHEGSWKDQATGISLSAVSTNEGIADATMKVTDINSGTERDTVAASLAQKYKGAPSFSLYKIELTAADGSAIELEDGAQVDVSMPFTMPERDYAVDKPTVYVGDGASMGKVSSDFVEGNLSFGFHGNSMLIAIVDNQANTLNGLAWSNDELAFELLTGSWTDVATGVSAEFSSTQYGRDDQGAVVSQANASSTTHELRVTEMTEGETFDSASDALDSSKQLGSMYALAIYAVGGDEPFTKFASNGNSLSVSVPANNAENAHLYLFTKNSSGWTKSEISGVTASGGRLHADLIGFTATGFIGSAFLTSFANGYKADGTVPAAYLGVVYDNAEDATASIDLQEGDVSLAISSSDPQAAMKLDGATLSATVETSGASYDAVAASLKALPLIPGAQTDYTPVFDLVTFGVLTADGREVTLGEGDSATATVPVDSANTAVYAVADDGALTKIDATITASSAATRQAGSYGTATFDASVLGTYAVVNMDASQPQPEPEPEDPEALEPGTYRITGNVFVPAEENDIMHLTAYMTNPANPMGIGGNTGIPTTPMTGNATLVVGADGKKTFVVELVNPAFTLIDLGTPSSNVAVAQTVKDDGTYGSSSGRITAMALELNDESGEYVFTDSHVYAAPLEADKTWDIHVGVDFASAEKTSDSTEVVVPGAPDPADPDTSGQTGSDPATPAAGNQVTFTQDGRLAPGTYTVSANIWFEKADTGLPMNPHITSSAFPPKDPVYGNATLVVDSSHNATVTVPITIQDKVMTVNSIDGLSIVDSSRGGNGGLSSVTVDLGVLENPGKVITQGCNISVTLGDLAQQMSGYGPDHTWPATFQVNLSGVAMSSGGYVGGLAQTSDDVVLGGLVLLSVGTGSLVLLASGIKRNRKKREQEGALI